MGSFRAALHESDSNDFVGSTLSGILCKHDVRSIVTYPGDAHIDALIEWLVPPANYQSRNGYDIAVRLKQIPSERHEELGRRFIELLDNNYDELVLDALDYMNTPNVLDKMYPLLGKCNGAIRNFRLAVSICKRSPDEQTVQYLVDEYYNLSGIYDKAVAITHLGTIKHAKTQAIVQSHAYDNDIFLRSASRRALGLENNAYLFYNNAEKRKWIATIQSFFNAVLRKVKRSFRIR